MNTPSLIGIDVGSSSVKVALVNAETGDLICSCTSPSQENSGENELPISSPRSDWAEQDPEVWWTHVTTAIKEVLAKSQINPSDIAGIGIGYQMHGLVLLDKNFTPLRSSIIWCDGRAVSIGERAFKELGPQFCINELFNPPGNFTASKLRWVKENESELFAKAAYFMLPGDYIALKLSGVPTTTETGLSEGVLWNFKRQRIATELLDYYEIPLSLVPKIYSSFEIHGRVTKEAAAATGLCEGTPLSYRAGDQPNNALALGVSEPGECAVNAGTSGVTYSIVNSITPDPEARVNIFLDPSSSETESRYGILYCLNGAGISNRWIRDITGETSYTKMDQMALSVPAGSEGITVFPFGNGPERSLLNRSPGASFSGIRFPTHTQAHLYRAVLEGVAYSLNYGMELVRRCSGRIKTCRAGKANMFLSQTFKEIFSNVANIPINLTESDGAKGAALGAGIGCGIIEDRESIKSKLKSLGEYKPSPELCERYSNLYGAWLHKLQTYVEE